MPFQEGNELENLLKIENECATIQSQVGSSGHNAHLQDSRRNNDKNAKDKTMISVANSSTEATPSSSRSMEYATTSRYEPDFNELVDDSSNELEIDMSDPSGEKDDDDDSDRSHKNEDRQKRKDNNASLQDHHKSGASITSSDQHASSSFQDRQHMFGTTTQQQRPFQPSKPTCTTATASSGILPTTATSSPTPSSSVSFSTCSAFRAINSSQSSKDSTASPRLPAASSSSMDLQGSVGNAIPPIGPYPAAATFVGYPGSVGIQGPGPETGSTHQHSVTSLDEKHTAAAVSLLQLKTNPKEEEGDKRQDAVGEETSGKTSSVSVASPDATSSKQYTILQPAGAGSRAATAIQDVNREGVLSVSAVSSSSNNNNNNNNSSSSSNSSSSASGTTVAPLHQQQQQHHASVNVPTPSSADANKMTAERSCSAEITRSTGPMSPSGLNRGKWLFFIPHLTLLI